MSKQSYEAGLRARAATNLRVKAATTAVSTSVRNAFDALRGFAGASFTPASPVRTLTADEQRKLLERELQLEAEVARLRGNEITLEPIAPAKKRRARK